MTQSTPDRQMQAAERTALRRWLRSRGVLPTLGTDPSHTELLMKQVHKASGDPLEVMKAGRDHVHTLRCGCRDGKGTCTFWHKLEHCGCHRCGGVDGYYFDDLET